MIFLAEDSRGQQGDIDLISAVARGRAWFDAWLNGEISGYKDIVEREGISSSYVGDLMKLAFLSPRLIEDIVDGIQPEGLMVSHLTRVDDMPLKWEDQASQYGWR